MSFGFPFFRDPASKLLFSGPEAHEISYEGVILHILNFGVDSFYREIKTGLILCMGYACVLSDKPVVFLSRFKSTIIIFFRVFHGDGYILRSYFQ